ncbi:hypothetical protein CMV_027683 [Castanea mollissima]|uniref:Uncharacterized protein n=1 Tax=Castanea mollissima TaxID=60419 RepID=A0A8J4QEX9_9ROSI|nr:hypothetical protein CMV_027683 [Castanea mollissima]
MDTLLPSLQILDIANYQQVESFPEGTRSAFPRRTSTSLSTLPIKEFQNLRSLDKKGLQLLTSFQLLSISHCPRLKARGWDFFVDEIKSHLTISKYHKRLGQTHSRSAVNKTIAKEEGKIVAKDWSHLLHKNGCPNPNQGIF